MHRRNFNAKLLLAGLAAPTLLTGASLPALAHDSDGCNGLEHYDRVTLRISGRRSLISYFVIPGEGGPSGIDLRTEVPQMAAERLDIGEVPIIGQIFTPPLDRQFAGATQIGSLYLTDGMIVLLPENTLPAQARHVWITHRKVVYRPPASIRALQLRTPMTPEKVKNAPPIGKAVLKGDIILGIVPPSALDDMDFGPPAAT